MQAARSEQLEAADPAAMAMATATASPGSATHEKYPTQRYHAMAEERPGGFPPRDRQASREK